MKNIYQPPKAKLKKGTSPEQDYLSVFRHRFKQINHYSNRIFLAVLALLAIPLSMLWFTFWMRSFFSYTLEEFLQIDLWLLLFIVLNIALSVFFILLALVKYGLLVFIENTAYFEKTNRIISITMKVLLVPFVITFLSLVYGLISFIWKYTQS